MGEWDSRMAGIVLLTGLDEDVVWTVLSVEFEYMWRIGIVEGPQPSSDWYVGTDLAGAPPHVVDHARIAADVARFTAIPEDVTLQILDAELDLLT